MALIQCPECKKEISTEASACPHCGYKVPKKQSLLVAIPVLLLVGFMAFKFGGNLNEFDKTAQRKADAFAAAAVPSSPTGVDDTLAKVACRSYVRSKLYPPSSTQFPTIDRFSSTRDAFDKSVITVSGFVTANDGSHSFNCTIRERSPGTFDLVDVAFFG